MRCHNCPHHEFIQRGDFDLTPWEELPCSSCHLHEEFSNWIHFDENHPPVPVAGYPFSFVTEFRPSLPQHAVLPVGTLSQFVQCMLCLPPEQRDIVSWRYQGVPYKEIAQRQGTSIQLAEMRHKLAIRDWPVLKSLFPYKTAKRQYRVASRRKTKRRRISK